MIHEAAGEDVISLKAQLRKRLKETLSSFSTLELHDSSVNACLNVIGTPQYARADTIMLFLSMATEVDTTLLVLQAWRDQKRVVVPRVDWNQRLMAAVEISSLNGQFNEPVTGLREPATGEIVSVDQIDMICVPGLGFDPEGRRIGRGGGFYDTFLSQPAWQGLGCGLAFEKQVVEEVPTTDHDMTVDMLITDNQVRYFKT